MLADRDVTAFAITGDETRVVFLADRDNDDVFQLYSVPLNGSTAPIRISTDLGASSKDVTSFLISLDSTRVVYLADQDTDEVFELYSVPVAGGTVAKLSGGTMVSGGDVLEFNISPNSAKVVFRADRITDGVGELFSVPIDGGEPDNISGSLVSGGSIVEPPPGLTSFLISTNSATVVFEADKEVDERYELYSVPIAGGTVDKLNGSLVAGGDVRNFLIDEHRRHSGHRQTARSPRQAHR
jgi:hypothetical protein